MLRLLSGPINSINQCQIKGAEDRMSILNAMEGILRVFLSNLSIIQNEESYLHVASALRQLHQHSLKLEDFSIDLSKLNLDQELKSFGKWSVMTVCETCLLFKQI